MPALPLELIRHVLEDIANDDHESDPRHHLSAVSLSCCLLRHEAQHLLFRDSGALYASAASRKKTTMFLDTIISSPERLALYVKTFSITFEEGRYLYPGEMPAFVDKTSNALKAMHNLKSIYISQDNANIPRLFRVLQHVPSQVTSFRWSGFSHMHIFNPDFNSNSIDPEAEDFKADFLRCHNNIEHLAISNFIDESSWKEIAADICPRLKSLSAPYSITNILMPGKEHLTSLQWTVPSGNINALLNQNFEEYVPPDLELVSKELGRIRYLSYDVSILPVGPNIRRIAPYLTSLVCLDAPVDIIKVCVVDGIISADKLNESLQQVDALSQLPRLKVLVLDARLQDELLRDCPDALIKVAASCTSLDHIDVIHGYHSCSRVKYDHSSASLQTCAISRSDMYLWANDFAAFDD